MTTPIHRPAPWLQAFSRATRAVPLLKRWWPSLMKRWAGATWPSEGRVFATAHGVFLLDHRNYVDRQMAFYGDFEDAQLTYFLDEMARSGCDAFLDIGANIGLYSIAVLNRFDVGVDVHAFEPDQRNLARLRTNLALNNLEDRATIHERAVTDTTHELTFLPADDTSTGKSRVGDGAGAQKIQGVALDDLLDWSEKRLFLKIDIEEHELSAVRGMTSLLSRNTVWLQVECFAQNLAALKAELAPLGIRHIHVIEDDHYFSNASPSDRPAATKANSVK